jgi:flavorubredoxin
MKGAGMQLPVLPTRAQPVAPDTWLVPTFAASPTGAYFGAHSLVIRGREPVIVDTGCRFVRDAWLEQAFSVVDPADVRWIFVSHDDHDHIGNLEVVLDRCPNATLLVSFAIVGRLALDVELPLERMRWVEPGDALDLGDRTLRFVRPPTFDSPATRGVYDTTTRLLWGADAFGALTQGEVYDATDVPADLYEPSFAALNTWNTPWLEWTDRDRFAAHVQATASLDLDVVAGAHGPVLRGTAISDAFRRTLDLVGQAPVPAPGPPLLDQLVSSLVVPASV